MPTVSPEIVEAGDVPSPAFRGRSIKPRPINYTWAVLHPMHLQEKVMIPELATAGTLAEQLLSRIELRTARVCVVGLGYVGLPLAETFAWGGFPVLGFDTDPEKIKKLRTGQSYIGHISSERVAELVDSGRFEATFNPNCFAEVDAVVICVPTPLTEAREPDLSYIINTGKAISK